jgi:hypothetical protein
MSDLRINLPLASGIAVKNGPKPHAMASNIEVFPAPFSPTRTVSESCKGIVNSL